MNVTFIFVSKAKTLDVFKIVDTEKENWEIEAFAPPLSFISFFCVFFHLSNCWFDTRQFCKIWYFFRFDEPSLAGGGGKK